MKYIISILLFITIILSGFNTYDIHFKKPKKDLVFVRTSEVFAKFLLKIEMEKKYIDETRNSGKYLDSLAFEIQVLSGKSEISNTGSIEFEKLENLKSLYYQKRSYYEKFASDLTANYDNQIITQMQQYIKDYGMMYNYEYVFGMDNDGLVLYGEKMNDVTEDVIEFINAKYQGEI